MGVSRYSLLLFLALAFVAVLWRFGRTVFAGITRWLLWALAALCAGVGVLAVVDAAGRPLALLAGFALWVFAVYAIKVAESLRRRSRGQGPLHNCQNDR